MPYEKVKVSKKADKIGENLLDDGKEDSQQDESIWSSIKSSFGSASDAALTEAKGKENVLNIFSLASGHLYERLMRIMMLTVLKNTDAKVKFWFLRNYLSPEVHNSSKILLLLLLLLVMFKKSQLLLYYYYLNLHVS